MSRCCRLLMRLREPPGTTDGAPSTLCSIAWPHRDALPNYLRSYHLFRWSRTTGRKGETPTWTGGQKCGTRCTSEGSRRSQGLRLLARRVLKTAWPQHLLILDFSVALFALYAFPIKDCFFRFGEGVLSLTTRQWFWRFHLCRIHAKWNLPSVALPMNLLFPLSLHELGALRVPFRES